MSVSFSSVAGCEAHQHMGWTWCQLAELRSRALKEITLDGITACGGWPGAAGREPLAPVSL